MHTLERYFSDSKEYEFSDYLALGLIKSVIDSGLTAYNEPNNYEARANLMIASSVSHSGITSICKGYKMPVHALEHGVSGVYPHVAHAAGLAVLFPKWARYYIEYDVDKYDRFAKEVFNLHDFDKMKNGLSGIAKLEEYFNKLNMPRTFKDLGIENPDIQTLVKIVTKDGTRIVGHKSKPMDENVVSTILNNCI
jgi:alcohol dehydrogenase YqhD (iron-dependent ADH family)